jgi:hypothetical protein
LPLWRKMAGMNRDQPVFHRGCPLKRASERKMSISLKVAKGLACYCGPLSVIDINPIKYASASRHT